jgi:hypothetical protein
MSATGRNLAGRERHEGDFYETPAWCTRSILPHVVKCTARNANARRCTRLLGHADDHAEPGCNFGWHPSGDFFHVLDAGSGTGAIGRVVKEDFHVETVVEGVELDDGRRGIAMALDHDRIRYRGGSFFDVTTRGVFQTANGPRSRKWDLVISNPPYVDAEGFVTHALRIAEVSCFLLRLNWLASKKRAAFHREHPADVFVLPRRPSFTNGGTDATEYAWFVWGEGRGNRWFLLDVPK